MAIYDRWHKTERQPDGTRKKVRSGDYGCRERWQVRWRDHNSIQRKESFERKLDAETADAKIRAQLADGTYVDQSAGKITFEVYAEQWRATRTHDLTTADRIAGALRRHSYTDPANPGVTRAGGPAIGGYPMRTLAQRPSILQGWIAGLKLGPVSAGKHIMDVSQVFAAAVDDGIIARNPLRAKSVQRPVPVKTEAVPWTGRQVADVASKLPARYQALPYLGAACGPRQGELFALAIEDVNFLRRIMRVEVQLKRVRGQLVFAPIKNKKTRDVPVDEGVIPVLSEHVRRFPPVEVTLPWARPDGKPVTRRLVFTNQLGQPLRRQVFNRAWIRAWKAAGVPDRGRKNGCHVLRHTAASVWLSAGVGLAEVAAHLGDTQEVVLATYSHFMPGDDGRARSAMRAFFASAEGSCAPDVPRALP